MDTVGIGDALSTTIMTTNENKSLFAASTTPSLASLASDKAAEAGDYTLASALNEHRHMLLNLRINDRVTAAKHSAARDRILRSLGL